MGKLSPNGVYQKDLVALLVALTGNESTNKTTLDSALSKLNDLIHLSNNRAFGNQSPGFVIDTNFDVKNGSTTLFLADNVLYTLGANTNADTGTTAVITGGNWGAFVIDASNASTLTVTWVSASQSYASEALALAAAKALPFSSGKARLGIVTVRAHASGFTAGTDALATGTGGNVAQNTNYYNLVTKTISALDTSTMATVSGTVSGDSVTV